MKWPVFRSGHKNVAPECPRNGDLVAIHPRLLDPILRLGLARPAFWIDRRHSHHPHQPFDSLVIDVISLPFQDFRHPRRPIKRRLQVLLVDHQNGPNDQTLLDGGYQFSGSAGDERDGGRLELEDQDGDEAGLRVQASQLSPDHHLSRRRSAKLHLPILNGREPVF